MTSGLDLLANVVFLRTYSATLSDGTKESWEQTVTRCMNMHIKRYPAVELDIRKAFKKVLEKKVVPSMRSMQFAGNAIERNHLRMFNCAYLPMESYKDLADAVFLLMSGSGVGYSVRKDHIRKLPRVVLSKGLGEIKFGIPDTKEGWAESFQVLMEFPNVQFDYTAIRPAGATLSTGGTASGPEPLRKAHNKIRTILLGASERQLTPLEVHDIVCHASDCVVVGGVRRSALISLFDHDDEEMLTCKSGAWRVDNGQRDRANNSAAIRRDAVDFAAQLDTVLERCFASGWGEPGVFLTNNEDWGSNPCLEIALQPRQLCNLTEVIVANIKSEDDFFECVWAATLIGTLQAGYTDFKFVSPKFKANCEAEALLGVSMTGLAQNWERVQHWLSKFDFGAFMQDVNVRVAAAIGINRAARIGCVKPSGSTSATLGCTSGIHAAHAPFFLRRVQIERSNPVAAFLQKVTPQLLCAHPTNPDAILLTVPVEMQDSIQREEETAIDLCERVRFINERWIRPSHVDGDNTHNVSVTVSYKEEERASVKKWMLKNATSFTGISLLPYDGGTYAMTPFETCTRAVYEEWLARLPVEPINWKAVDFSRTADERIGEMACSGGVCEIK